MKDAFGVEKAWKGEPGDKRNTKYAAAWGLGPVPGVAYTIYRQGATSKANRKRSIALKKKERKG